MLRPGVLGRFGDCYPKEFVQGSGYELIARFLAFLLNATGGNTCQAVASYYQGLDTLHQVGVLQETQPYVRNVLALVPRFAGTAR